MDDEEDECLEAEELGQDTLRLQIVSTATVKPKDTSDGVKCRHEVHKRYKTLDDFGFLVGRTHETSDNFIDDGQNEDDKRALVNAEAGEFDPAQTSVVMLLFASAKVAAALQVCEVLVSFNGIRIDIDKHKAEK